MNVKNALIVMKKDIMEFRSTKYVMFTLILMPLVFCIFLPIIFFGSFTGVEITNADLEEMGVKPVEGIPPSQLLFQIMISNFIFLFILIPMATPSIIGSYSIVGEKESKSLEPLLSTPIEDSDLLAGKILAGVVPAVVTTLMSFCIFTVIVNMMVVPGMGIWFVPGLEWFIAMLILAPLFAFLSMVMTVILSSRMNDIRAVQQTGSILVLPVVGLYVISLAGQDMTNPIILLSIAGITLAIDIFLFRVARRLFQREEILTKWK